MNDRPGMHQRRERYLAAERNPGILRRANRWFWEEFVLETVGELIVALVACALFVAATAAVIWGLANAPKSTAALLTGLFALVAYGIVVLRRGAAHPRSAMGAVAVFSLVFLGIWATYVLQYCSCY